jgi:hypothetical protein
MRAAGALPVILCASLGWIPMTASAQAQQQNDTLVDILGLKRWTRQELEAAAQRYEPGLSLASSACAVVLRDSVGFDAASVVIYPSWRDHPTWVIITVVEPGRGVPVPTVDVSSTNAEALPPRWQELDSILIKSLPDLSRLQDPAFLLTDTTYAFHRPVSASALALRARLRELNSPADLHLALRLIQQAKGPEGPLAAAVLSNFPESGEAWAALLRADERRGDSGSGMADMIMAALARSGRFTVDWSGSERVLESAFSGWNAFALPTVMAVLVQTSANKAEVLAALRKEPDLVFEYLSAKNPYTPNMARTFLTYLAGEDLGTDASAWRERLGLGGSMPTPEP